jgi:hypothetical protein
MVLCTWNRNISSSSLEENSGSVKVNSVVDC